MTIAVTGHRPHKLGNDYELESPLLSTIGKMIKGIIMINNGTTLISGMALGIDTLFAEIAIDLDLPLIAAIPFKGQELHWPPHSQERYHRILNYPKCTKKIVSAGGYAGYKMNVRNMWMVNQLGTGLLIAVWDGSAGGTRNCVAYAAGRVNIIRIDPSTLKMYTFTGNMSNPQQLELKL